MQKSAKIGLSKSIFYVKNHHNLFHFFIFSMKNSKYQYRGKDVFKSHLNSIMYSRIFPFFSKFHINKRGRKKMGLCHESFGYQIKLRINKYFGPIMKVFYKVCKHTETNDSLLQFSLCFFKW